MVEPVRHDWPRIIREIKAGYGRERQVKLTDYKLGLMIAGTDKKTVQRWIKKRAKPDHYRGELLLAYHREFHRETRDAVPTTLRQTADV